MIVDAVPDEPRLCVMMLNDGKQDRLSDRYKQPQNYSDFTS